MLLRRSRKKHSRDVVCFHFQQWIEKYLKARLAEAGLPIAKIHDLERLLDLILPAEPSWELLRPWLAEASDFAVDIRYPGRSSTPEEARALQRATMHVRATVRLSLGIKAKP